MAEVKSTEYKMRAECSADLGRFLMAVSVLSFSAIALKLEGNIFIPDMGAIFTSTLSLDQLRKEMAEIEDGHVMLESLNYIDAYTGERYFLGA